MNRVTVYERPDGASLYIEWWDSEGRHQKSLKTHVGYPVTDQELAKEIARAASEEQKKLGEKRASRLWRGYEPHRTIGELHERYFADKWESWSEGHQDSQRRYREFWEEQLGVGRTLLEVDPALVERKVESAASREDWSPRTERGYLQFIVAAFSYAERKLKWIDQRHNLSAVDLPSPRKRRKGLAYSTSEAIALLDALPSVDERAAAFGEIAFITGRRLNAIRTLPKAAYEELSESAALIQFSHETDKAGHVGEAVIAGRAKEAVERLLGSAGPWLFPRLTDPERTIRSEKLNELLHEAEDAAGIEHVTGRAWHGLKRRFATIAEDRKAASRQSSTREQTLAMIYEQDDLEPKVELAEELARVREQGGEV